MIGNDIVDLSFVSKTSNWKRKGFLNKVFTASEQQEILSSEDQNQKVWQFWSMKEAAYKTYVQTHDVRFFNPKVLSCELVSETRGKVVYGKEKYFTQTKFSEQFVYTTASANENLQGYSIVIKANQVTYKSQTRILKARVLEYISNAYNLNTRNLRIIKNSLGVPKVYEDLKELPIHLSLTHCGTFLAFSVIDSKINFYSY